jgi:cytochrome bd ubiquinol oxidase subunit I
MRVSETVLLAAAQVPGDIVPDRAQMATTLGFHIILACFGIAFPSIVLLAEFIGLRRADQTAMLLARRWSQAMGVLVAVGAVTGTVLSFEMGLLWPGLMRQYGAVLGVPFAVEGLFFFLEAIGGFTQRDGRITSIDVWQVFFSRSAIYEMPHMILAAYLVAGFGVASVYAVGILRGRRVDRRSAIAVRLVIKPGLPHLGERAARRPFGQRLVVQRQLAAPTIQMPAPPVIVSGPLYN